MSTSRTDYLVMGASIDEDAAKKLWAQTNPDKEYWWNELPKGLEEVSDPMSGDFMIIGRVLAKGEEFEGFNLTEYDPEELAAIAGEVKALLEPYPVTERVKLYVVSQFG